MEAEMHNITLATKGSEGDDVEAGRVPDVVTEEELQEEEDKTGEDGTVHTRTQSVKKKETVLRLGEGKLTGPMRFITCYATAFAFIFMMGAIVWLLLISTPSNTVPETVRGKSQPRRPTTTASTNITTTFSPFTQAPVVSDDLPLA